jgi:hypothetical protein
MHPAVPALHLDLRYFDSRSVRAIQTSMPALQNCPAAIQNAGNPLRLSCRPEAEATRRARTSDRSETICGHPIQRSEHAILKSGLAIQSSPPAIQ